MFKNQNDKNYESTEIDKVVNGIQPKVYTFALHCVRVYLFILISIDGRSRSVGNGGFLFAFQAHERETGCQIRGQHTRQRGR